MSFLPVRRGDPASIDYPKLVEIHPDEPQLVSRSRPADDFSHNGRDDRAGLLEIDDLASPFPHRKSPGTGGDHTGTTASHFWFSAESSTASQTA